ncbi:heparan sulfate 2-O-sulfotransferase pipe isoform X1 [Bactrocera dorsalis]|uniref:Heparan sulfate 2-O-sulfotransferase pipe isoform X1 n=1 Tax=Bactrocera dorsalis TaxID=27457 RepID=A0A6I9W6S8_BACDO|nr:heparan sulfate 2-O-sulfotransferase pipe isoform X1 [Bactrocera dorsalis]
MSLGGEKSFKMRMRDMENAFKYRRIPYPKRSVELIAILAISCTFFLFMHTNKLNSRLKEMEIKLQPSEFSALGLTGNQISPRESSRRDNINTLHGTYQYLKSTGQRNPRNVRRRHHVNNNIHNLNNDNIDEGHQRHHAAHHGGKVHKEGHPHSKLHKVRPHGQHTSKFEDSHNHDEFEDTRESANAIGDDDSDDDEETADNDISTNDLNNTKNADVDLILFNRVAKVGSQSLMQLMTRLGKLNGFTTSRDSGKRYETVLIGPHRQRELMMEVLTMPKPHAYSQHLAYINFTRFHLPKPIYINLVRHPIERIISWHYYVRAEWYYKDMKDKLGDKAPPRPSDEFMNMDLDTCVKTNNLYCQFNQDEIINPAGDHRRQTLFFCGQNRKLCMPFNSVAAMQKAKRTVEQDYAVVGTWEDTNITLSVLEHYIPKFFKHAKVVYYMGKEHLSKVNKNPVKRSASQETREILSKNLTNEIEFYEFCKQRLYLQYSAISNFGRIDNDDYVLLPQHSDDDEIYDDDY